nr:hypothetical protein [uncultured Desulfobacter sp.]
MNKPARNQGAQQQKQAPPELIQRFLEVQSRELDIKVRELELEAQREKNNKAVAEISIKANLDDRSDERTHVEKVSRYGMILIGFIVTLFAAVACYCLYLGKEALLMKVAEIIAIFAAGFFTGFGYQAIKKSSNKTPNDDIQHD